MALSNVVFTNKTQNELWVDVVGLDENSSQVPLASGTVGPNSNKHYTVSGYSEYQVLAQLRTTAAFATYVNQSTELVAVFSASE